MSTSLVIGNMIGSGVFLLPASLAVYGGISIIGWIFTTTGALLLALVFSQLSKNMPSVGGPYAFTRRGLGDFAGFLVAWGYWISIWCGNAAIAIAFVGYAAVFWPALIHNPLLAGLTALTSIWFLTWINTRGIKSAGIVQVTTTILKLTPLIAISTLGIFFINLDHFSPFNLSGQSNFSAITSAAALTLWAFLGLESSTIPADNIKNPSRIIPRATILGTLITAAVYVLGTIAVMGVIPPAALATSTAPFADAAKAMWGSWAGNIVAAGAAISCFGALNGWILMQGQIPFAAARDRLFPASFSRLSGRGTPVVGIIVSSLLATALMSLNYTKGLVEQFTFIILLATLATLLPYIFSTMSHVIILIKTRNKINKTKFTRDAIIAVLAFIYSFWAVTGIGRDILSWGFLLLLAGVPVYACIKWHYKKAT